MGTAILRSQNCLPDRFRHETLTLTAPLKPRRNPITTNPNVSHRRRRKRSPNSSDRGNNRSQSQSMVVKFPAKNLVMGQVKILKRGETLKPRAAKSEKKEDSDLVLGSTDRLGPDPETVQKQIGGGIYAGSAFFASPPPSSVPFPGFLGRNGAATSDLRRLLRLD